ncbi:MAG: hypothetical protein ACP5HS_14255 [Anaerolineae bacterium]
MDPVHKRVGTAVVLAVTGSALLLLSLVLRPGGREQGPELPLASPRPSPTWAAMPTRAVDVPPIDAALVELRTALLQSDLAAAEVTWQEIQNTDLAESAEAQRLGARLALLQRDLETAERCAWHAVTLRPTSAESWSLLGVILRRSREPQMANAALGVAAWLDPGLTPELFDDRWRTAVRSGDAEAIVALAGYHSLRHPNGALEPYYRAQALLVTGEHELARDVLMQALENQPDAPALLWYALGDADLARSYHGPAATALEVAASKLAHGDDSLYIATDDPLTDLNVRLARAYLATERCAEAESIYRRLSDKMPELAPWIARAVVCQTPTPTLTPWIPKQIGTVTPRP